MPQPANQHVASAPHNLEPVPWKSKKIIDCHTHYRYQQPPAHFWENVRLSGASKICILAGPAHGDLPVTPGILVTPETPVTPENSTLSGQDGLDRKRDEPASCFIFRMPVQPPEKIAAHDGSELVKEIERALADGCDGIKMMDGKPAYRRGWQPLRVDDRYFAAYWERCAAVQIPITIHVADPVDFWDPQMKESYAGLEPQEEFFRQMINVLERNPTLRVNLAHFFFMGPQLDRLGDLFAQFANLHVDLALGPEFLFYCSADPVKAREFFIRWSERILYGTDLNDANSHKLARAKAATLQKFLETDETFHLLTLEVPGQPPPMGSNGVTDLKGIALPPEALDNILWRNFEKFAGAKPHPAALQVAPVNA
ncbi:MAG: amidohydrolase family protein [Planctomycetota bacterium]